MEEESFSTNYGEVKTLEDLAGNWKHAVEGKKRTNVGDLVEEMAGSEVLIRGRVDANRSKSEKLVFVNLKDNDCTVQCVAKPSEENIVVGVNMIRFLKQLSRESVVDVIGVVLLPKNPIIGTTQQVEIQVRKVYLIGKALQKLPLNVEDAARSEEDVKAGKPGVRQDVRLDNRVIDLRTPANQAIFRLQYEVEKAFRSFLETKDFCGIHTPKILSGSSEGGSAVFGFRYYEKDACLAQSPQLHKQMAISADFPRVFEVGPVFRAEKSSTHRHLSEFIGLDVEMQIMHYYDIMDLVEGMFLAIFSHLNENENCKRHLEAVGKQYPFKPLKFLPVTLRLTFAEGVQMLKEAGVEVDPLKDLSTESERKLGQLVLEKYKTEFFILHRFPLAARPFYTMPCADDPRYSNSFDVFLRGEEIISGAQRIHIPELLEESWERLARERKEELKRKRKEESNIDVIPESSEEKEEESKNDAERKPTTYFESFRYGTPPHGGFGVGLERVIMLFCALDNIRKTSLFPRDPNRLSP